MIIDIILIYWNWVWNSFVALIDMSDTLAFLASASSSFPTVMGYLMKFDFVFPVQFMVATLLYMIGVYSLYLAYWFFMLVLLIWRSIKIL